MSSTSTRSIRTVDTMEPSASASGTFRIAGDLPVHRLGFGAMRLTGPGIWGPPRDRDAAIRVLRRAVGLGVTFIDTADSYGPDVSERLIAEALHPYACRSQFYQWHERSVRALRWRSHAVRWDAGAPIAWSLVRFRVVASWL
jgi:Aldo/keto reductase family